MANETNGAPEAAEAQAPRLQILNQYTRDLSFENLAVQKGLASDGKPEVRVAVNVDAQKRGDDRYEVALKVKVESNVGESPVFILELDFAGLFTIQNVPEQQLHPVLMIECPRLIFPYVRRIVGDVTRDGAYPPLNLEMIDFVALYRAELARRQQATAKPVAQA
jgi:preprotein translocase subunit SecB